MLFNFSIPNNQEEENAYFPNEDFYSFSLQESRRLSSKWRRMIWKVTTQSLWFIARNLNFR